MRTAQRYSNLPAWANSAHSAAQDLFIDFLNELGSNVENWYGAFQKSAYKLLAGFGLNEDEAEYLLRGGSFCFFVADLLSTQQPQAPVIALLNNIPQLLN